MGGLALCKIPALQNFAVHDPLPSLNVFWEIGFFTFGLTWLQMIKDQGKWATRRRRR
jgi:hypothetical protein